MEFGRTLTGTRMHGGDDALEWWRHAGQAHARIEIAFIRSGRPPMPEHAAPGASAPLGGFLANDASAIGFARLSARRATGAGFRRAAPPVFSIGDWVRDRNSP